MKHIQQMQPVPTMAKETARFKNYIAGQILRAKRNVAHGIDVKGFLQAIEDPASVNANAYRRIKQYFNSEMQNVENLHLQKHKLRIVQELGTTNSYTFNLEDGNLANSLNGRRNNGIENVLKPTDVYWAPRMAIKFGRLVKNQNENGRPELFDATFGDPTVFGALEAAEVEHAYNTGRYNVKISQLVILENCMLNDYRIIPSQQGGTVHSPKTDNTNCIGYQALQKSPIIVDSTTVSPNVTFPENANLKYRGNDPDNVSNVLIFEMDGYLVKGFAPFVKSVNDYYVS